MEQTHGSSSTDLLPAPLPGGRSLTTRERADVDLSSRIDGWGSDLDAAKRAGVPRDRAVGIGPEFLYPDIEPQQALVRIHKSTEHARLTPVFGTSSPPSGLSGRLRDLGYGFSEGRLSRWLTLMLADRVDVIEDIVGDLARGRIPNLSREMGMRSEWQYNRAGAVRKAAVALACVAAIVWVARSRSHRRYRG
jgi:hypothetical protein